MPNRLDGAPLECAVGVCPVSTSECLSREEVQTGVASHIR